MICESCQQECDEVLQCPQCDRKCGDQCCMNGPVGTVCNICDKDGDVTCLGHA